MKKEPTKPEAIKITSIKISIAGKGIELTPEQAKQLRDALNNLYKSESASEAIDYGKLFKELREKTPLPEQPRISEPWPQPLLPYRWFDNWTLCMGTGVIGLKID